MSAGCLNTDMFARTFNNYIKVKYVKSHVTGCFSVAKKSMNSALRKDWQYN